MTRSGQLQGENRKEYLRITRIFNAEDGCFWVKRRRFRFFKQALKDEEHFFMFYLSMREDDIWNQGFAYDDYEAALQNAAEQAGQADAVPNME